MKTRFRFYLSKAPSTGQVLFWVLLVIAIVVATNLLIIDIQMRQRYAETDQRMNQLIEHLKSQESVRLDPYDNPPRLGNGVIDRLNWNCGFVVCPRINEVWLVPDEPSAATANAMSTLETTGYTVDMVYGSCDRITDQGCTIKAFAPGAVIDLVVRTPVDPPPVNASTSTHWVLWHIRLTGLDTN